MFYHPGGVLQGCDTQRPGWYTSLYAVRGVDIFMDILMKDYTYVGKTKKKTFYVR